MFSGASPSRLRRVSNPPFAAPAQQQNGTTRPPPASTPTTSVVPFFTAMEPPAARFSASGRARAREALFSYIGGGGAAGEASSVEEETMDPKGSLWTAKERNMHPLRLVGVLNARAARGSGAAVAYVGSGLHATDAATVVAAAPFGEGSSVAYFEVRLETGRAGGTFGYFRNFDSVAPD